MTKVNNYFFFFLLIIVLFYMFIAKCVIIAVALWLISYTL